MTYDCFVQIPYTKRFYICISNKITILLLISDFSFRVEEVEETPVPDKIYNVLTKFFNHYG